jgi:low affinity Fe/Cu permease
MTSFARVTDAITDGVGHPITFLAATLGSLAWPIFDRPFDWLDAASAMTLWLLFGLQASQNRQGKEWSAELRELVRAVPEADESVVNDD